MKNFRLCREDYEEVKQRLNMGQVAEFYGYKPNRKGICRCPFHNDGHPSMKIYDNNGGFYCFSCGEGGDIIKFVALLYNLRNEEACRKLIEDFALPIKVQELSYREQRERQQKIGEYRKLRNFQMEAWSILSEYRKRLCDAAQNFADPRFEEALQELSITEYRLECLKNCPDQLYKDRKAVKKIGEIQRRITGWDE